MNDTEGEPNTRGRPQQRDTKHMRPADLRILLPLLVMVVTLGLATALFVVALNSAKDNTQEWLYLTVATILTGILLFIMYQTLKRIRF